ncbi:MAG: Low-affinity inorganic phosphate transporter 1 [Actinobacteria bacterium ADurb.BinA094]|nr:MAG: Low-affinity inorganic phosphate transporter 1 [Actinobacteria bacterium ADurb.BinA094]
MILLLAIIVLALVFDYTNGFHDTANAIATAVSTRAIPPRVAVLMAAILNFVGALVSTSVATTVGQGIVDTHLVTLPLVLAALVGAVVWNFVTWYFGLPSSSSQALFGGLIGAMLAAVGVSGVEWGGVILKIILPMILSPVAGFVAAWLTMTALFWIVRRQQIEPVNRTFKRLQWFSTGFVAFSHGGNDAQKTMGVITLALFASGSIPQFAVPFWVKLACALAMAAGTYSGGWRIIHTMGSKMMKLDPVHGFAAQASAAVVIEAATRFGLPVSTTQTITAAIMGTGSARRLSSVRWGVAGDIATAWVLTLPAAALVSAGIYLAGVALL